MLPTEKGKKFFELKLLANFFSVASEPLLTAGEHRQLRGACTRL